ncbi:MAG: hypothetical protein KC425_20315 [Anaerolineales bacterium]|nr:hypothetical protein [Anaerolineales bacterium]
MLKKLLLATLFTALIAVLVIGGIRRSQVKLAQVADTAVANSQAAGAEQAAHDDCEDETAVSLPAPAAWQTLDATVTDVRPSGLWLQDAAGAQLRVKRQPWTYAQAGGFTAAVGDVVQVTGYTDGGAFEVCALQQAGSSLLVQLRDADGRALWHTAETHD